MYLKSLMIALFCLMATCLQAYDASPSCYKDLELNFFQRAVVSQALNLHRVDQGAWTPIVQILQETSKRVPALIKAKALRLSPNPFDPVFIPELARQLLEETLFEVFSGVMISYNPYQQLKINGGDIQDMFNYILNSQAKRMERCFGIIKKAP